MDLSRPARTVVPSLTADVLVVLAGTSRPLGAREVHRLVEGASWGGVRKVLTHLADTGLANVAEAGNATLYTLNREHVAAEAVLALVDLRARLFVRMRSAMLDWSRPPVSAVIFGSAARGDGHLGSDIDVLVIRPSGVRADDPQWSGDVTALGASIRSWSGNPASILDVTKRDVRSMLRRGEPIIADLERDQIVLVGDPVTSSRDSR
jgi:hypothetical protein